MLVKLKVLYRYQLFDAAFSTSILTGLPINLKRVGLLWWGEPCRVCAYFCSYSAYQIEVFIMEQKKFTATGFLRIFNATGYSFKGIKRAWKTEAAVRQEFMLAAFLLPLAFVLAQSLAQVVVMILSLFIVVITELLNTSIEYAIDRIGSEHHDLSGAAKDIASAAVFFSLAQVVTIWGCIVIYNMGLFSFPLVKIF